MMTLDEGGWRRSTVRTVAAPPALRWLVELFWIDEWRRGESAARQFRVVADDAPHVIWHLPHGRGHRSQHLTLVGARSVHHDVDLTGRHLLVGARLRPGALPVLAETPALGLTNRSLPLVEIARPSVARTIRRLRPTSADATLECLMTLVESLARGSKRTMGIDERAVWIGGGERTTAMNVSAVGGTLGMPARTLRAWSATQFGMGLKRFLKIRRLHAALEMRLSGSHDTWGRVAAAAGYADQSHLVRDCCALLGEPPTSFVQRAG